MYVSYKIKYVIILQAINNNIFQKYNISIKDIKCNVINIFYRYIMGYKSKNNNRTFKKKNTKKNRCVSGGYREHYDFSKYDDAEELNWAESEWRRYNERWPIPINNIEDHIPPPVDERIQPVILPSIPEGCRLSINTCVRTNAENNNPYNCGISESNRCILKKKWHRPVGCKLTRPNRNRVCKPILEGEVDEPNECVINDNNRCVLKPYDPGVPASCIAVPFKSANRFGESVSFKCKPTDNADDNQPEYCYIDSLDKCRKKKSYTRKGPNPNFFPY
jgi:hypothetical protein